MEPLEPTAPAIHTHRPRCRLRLKIRRRHLFAVGGVLFDYVQNPQGHSDETFAYSPYLTYAWSHWNQLRLQYTHTDHDAVSGLKSDDAIYLQWAGFFLITFRIRKVTAMRHLRIRLTSPTHGAIGTNCACNTHTPTTMPSPA